MYCAIEATDRHEASRGLSATAGLLVITAALEADILTNKKAQTTKTIPGRCLRRSEIIKLTVFCITADVAEFFSIIHIVIIVDEKY